MRNGPAAMAIDASAPGFNFLKGSPWNQPCGNNVNHAVLLVGWDERYWIIKNSWGSGWGIDGYLYLPRKRHTCGIERMFGMPIVKKGSVTPTVESAGISSWFF